MDIVREVRLSDRDRIELQGAFSIIRLLANEVKINPVDVFRNMELACHSEGNSYKVPDTLEMEIFE